MKIGVRMPPMGREMGIEAFCEWLAENGFETLDTGPLSPAIVAAMEKSGIGIGSVDAKPWNEVLSPDEATRRKAVADFKESLTTSAGLGAKVFFVVLAPEDPTRGRDQNFEIWKSVYPEIVAHAEALNVSIAIEPWPGGAPHYPSLGCTPEMWRAIFKVCPSPNLGICFDPSHLVRMGIDYLRAVHEFGGRVKHVHAKDTEVHDELLYEHGIYGPSFGGSPYRYGEGWWRYCIPGDGQVDWSRFIARLQDHGYEGCLSIELEDHRYCGDPEKQKAGLLAAAEHLDACMPRV